MVEDAEYVLRVPSSVSGIDEPQLVPCVNEGNGSNKQASKIAIALFIGLDLVL